MIMRDVHVCWILYRLCTVTWEMGEICKLHFPLIYQNVYKIGMYIVK